MRAFVQPNLVRDEIADDPRLTRSQVAAIRRVWSSDPDAEVIGLDAKLRPVLRCRLHSGTTTYALIRNGDPTKVIKPMSETWR